MFAGSSALMMAAVYVPAQGNQGAKSKVPVKPLDGAALFKAQCAPCHGAKGEGGPAYGKPLVGSRSASELSKFIHQSMPPGKPATAPDAQKIAAFMFDAFYSPLAQERNRPARVALSRLTVRQFRNAVADLVGWSRPVVPNAKEHGLRGQYFKGRDQSAASRVIERVDSEVKFDFGTDGPVPNQFDPHTFTISWEGSMLAPDTGEYELVVQTDHSARLWFNGEEKPLIDAWVKSGSDTEFKAPVNLLGGRAYPITLVFSKASQGVDDAEKKKGKPAPKAFVSLMWRRPKRTLEAIPSRNLFPSGIASTYVVSSPFPPDDRSIGYERGNSVSKAWDEATTAAALETAAYVSENLRGIAGIPDDAADRKARAQAYCRSFVERAFRRPLTKEIEQTYVTKQFEVAPTVEMAVKRVIILALKSPRFLYREVGARERDGYLAASQLSFGLWDSLPDPELEKAAASGQLSTPEQIQRQAERMVNDPRTWTKLRDFLLLWLKVDEVPDIVKNGKRYPGFDATAASDLRTSLELFLENTAWSPDADYRQLLLSQTQYLNGRLAKMYGVSLPENAPFQAVELDPGQRAGVLTHPYLLSRFAYLDNSSPIHRGVLIARNMLGRTLSPPPAAFAPLAPSLHPSLTTRERVSLQTKPATCNSCHSMINPLGFTLEKFDAIGRLRATDNGKPVDATGSYQARDGKLIKFSGAADLANYLANSDEAHAAFVEKLFQHLVKQPVLAYGGKTLPNLEAGFAKSRYSIRSLMVQTMVATALPPVAPTKPALASKGGGKP